MVGQLEKIYNNMMDGALKAAKQFLKDEKKESRNRTNKDKGTIPNNDKKTPKSK